MKRLLYVLLMGCTLSAAGAESMFQLFHKTKVLPANCNSGACTEITNLAAEINGYAKGDSSENAKKALWEIFGNAKFYPAVRASKPFQSAVTSLFARVLRDSDGLSSRDWSKLLEQFDAMTRGKFTECHTNYPCEIVGAMESAAQKLSCDQSTSLLKTYAKNYDKFKGDSLLMKNRFAFGKALSQAQKSACTSEGRDLKSDDAGSAAFQ